MQLPKDMKTIPPDTAGEEWHNQEKPLNDNTQKEDAARWQFLMQAVDDTDGAEADAMNRASDTLPDDAPSTSATFLHIVDTARASLSP